MLEVWKDMLAARRVFLFAAAALALACHLLVLALHLTLGSSIIEFALLVLVALACFQASRRAEGLARRFWRLITLGFALYAVGQIMATYYDSVLHAPATKWWPSDILFLFHLAPMALALFLSDDEATSRFYRWQQWLDFLQIGIVSFSAYIFFLYLPQNLPHTGLAADKLYVEATAWRGLLVAVAFALRATLTHSKLVRSLFGRMAIFLTLFTACGSFYGYLEVWRDLPFGTWYELLWSVPRTLMVWLAVSWTAPAEPEPAARESASESLLLAQFAHIAFPLLVLAMAASALQQQLKVAVITVLASFTCSSVRLFLGQRAQKELLLQQQRSTESLRAAEARFRGLLESAPDAMIVVDPMGRIVLVNGQAEAAFGYSRDELLGQSVEKLIPARFGPQYTLLRADFFAHPKTRPMGPGFDIYALRKDGTEFPAEVSLGLLETEQGPWVSAAIRDLTERKKLESQFRQAQKMESIGTLAGGVAHDFNNLLTVILSYGSSLSTELPAGSRQQQAAEEISKAAERGAALTRQMLAFSRQQVFQLRVLNLNDIIVNLLSMLRRIIGEHIEINASLAPDLAPIKADAGQLEQVLMNLTVNARDAMPRGGRLTIETGNVTLDDEFVRNHVGSTAGEYVLWTVSDTGIGMDPTTLARIFEPFFTTKEPGSGTGLGLAMVYGVVKQSGGYIWVYSEVSQGSTFKIYLPQSAQPVESVAAPRKMVETAARGSETILLVEDDPAVRELVEAMLSRQGYKVVLADAPSDVETVCKGHSGPIHLLLSDLILPGTSGREVAAKVAVLRPKVKVLFMSGYTDDALIQSHGFEESFAFLQKPFTSASLGAKIREVLRKGATAAPRRRR